MNSGSELQTPLPASGEIPGADVGHLLGAVETDTVPPPKPLTSPEQLLDLSPPHFDLFLREQLSFLEKEREKLNAERRAANEVIVTRQQELSRQAQLLIQRVREVYERERRVTAEEAKLASGHLEGIATQSAQSTDLERASVEREKQLQDEIRQLHQQLEERGRRLEEVQTERDSLNARISCLEGQLQLAELRKLKDGDGSDDWVLLPGSLPARQDVSQRELARLREQTLQLEQMRAERDAALSQLRQRASGSADWAAREAEFAQLHRELKQDRRRLEERIEKFQQREKELRDAEAHWKDQIEQGEKVKERQRAEMEVAKQSLASEWEALRKEEGEFRALCASFRT
jgi:myosin heavy subunit